jgi:hypothetical protein
MKLNWTKEHESENIYNQKHIPDDFEKGLHHLMLSLLRQLEDVILQQSLQGSFEA